jgi:hypothetical protein
MHRISPLTQALITGLAFAFLATAAQAATTTGVVVSTDTPKNVMTIRTASGQNFSFEKNDATTIDPVGTATWFVDLEPGATITVTSDQVPTDTTVRLLATHVQIDKKVAAAPVAVAAVDEPMRAEQRLPTTATPLALVMLAAMGSLIAGIGLRARRA